MSSDVFHQWVDVSTVLAGVAGMWTIAFAWWTYVVTIHNHNENKFVALRGTVQGIRSELELMKPWTGAGGDGYSKSLPIDQCPKDWYVPSRIIWKFSYDTIRGVPSSPFLYHLHAIVKPLVELTFSISRLFQFYDEYRGYVNGRPDLYDSVQWNASQGQGSALTKAEQQYLEAVFDFNYRIHCHAIGGRDSEDANCLFHAYGRAATAVDEFDRGLRVERLPKSFWAVHILSILSFVGGLYLLMRVFLA
jgi:hypothetical protein